MSVRYHINPERGPLRCTASSPERCKYGSDAPHFNSVGEAEKVWQSALEEQYGALGGAQKKPQSVAAVARTDFLRNIDTHLPSDIIEFADKSRTNHEAVSAMIDDRCAKTADKFDRVMRLAPVPGVSGVSSARGWLRAREEYWGYLDRTADLVDAHTQSKFYRSSTEIIDPSTPVGTAVPAHAVNPGGFIDNKVIQSVDAHSLITRNTPRRMPEDFDLHNRRTGAWGQRIIDGYAANNPDLVVSRLSGHYVSSKSKGLASDMNNVAVVSSNNGKTELLFPMTTSNPANWGSVPAMVRTNALYALHVTEIDRAKIRVMVNDHEVRDFTVHRNDEVVPGSGVSMSRYLRSLQCVFTRTA